jgi:hypothetical protein
MAEGSFIATILTKTLPSPNTNASPGALPIGSPILGTFSIAATGYGHLCKPSPPGAVPLSACADGVPGLVTITLHGPNGQFIQHDTMFSYIEFGLATPKSPAFTEMGLNANTVPANGYGTQTILKLSLPTPLHGQSIAALASQPFIATGGTLTYSNDTNDKPTSGFTAKIIAAASTGAPFCKP